MMKTSFTCEKGYTTQDFVHFSLRNASCVFNSPKNKTPESLFQVIPVFHDSVIHFIR